MSHFHPGLISAYNSLTDKHLSGYFSNSRIRRHLQRAGLITRSGRIVPDKEYRHKLIQRAHQKHVRECLAQAIFHKVLEMERVHQIEIKRKLEEFARRERVHKIKVERSKRYEEDLIRILSPRPPTGARAVRKQHSGPEGEHSESSESPGSSRPNTAPGKMQRPVRLKPINSNSATASLRRSSPYRLLDSSAENQPPFNCTMEKESRRRLTTIEPPRGISPYCLPVINNFVTPVPPATKRKERGSKVNASGTLRGRRLRSTTASSGPDATEDPPMLRSSVHQSRVCVNMVYFGKTVHLSHDLSDMRDEVKVFQQHCGGENLCVYKGYLGEGETFQLISRRHRGFPFSLTFFLNGLQVERLSSCCEFKHRKGSRLGGRHGHFGFLSVEGASPCYKCIIAMGLDKKPTPPPKRVKEDRGREESAASPKEDAPGIETGRTGEGAAPRSECDTSPTQEVEGGAKEETAPEEDKVRDDYEEDFEADDEGPAEDVEENRKRSPSPAGQTEVKERDASETEDDEKDEDMRSGSGSSSSDSDREESEAEEEQPKDSREEDEETAETPGEKDQVEAAAAAAAAAVVVPPEGKDQPPEEKVEESESTVNPPQDSDMHNSAGDSTEVDISDTSNENKEEEKEVEKEVEGAVDEGKQEQEEELDRAKSVQEKLADAILKEPPCSSEPELSDTSTEEEEFTDKSPKQENKDAVQDEPAPERPQTPTEETKCEEESVAGEAEVVVVEDQEEETPEPRKQEETEIEPEPHEDSNLTKDGEVEEEIDDKAASEKDNNAITENGGSECAEDPAAAPHPEPEEETTFEGATTQEPREEVSAVESTKAAEEDEENKVETTVEADETRGQEAPSSQADGSTTAPEPSKETDETAVYQDAEAAEEAMTTEMKEEPSGEPEAPSCEEAPLTETGEKQEDTTTASETETEVTAEKLSSSPEGSKDTTVEKLDTGEGDKDDIKEEEDAEEVPAVEAGNEDNQPESVDIGEESIEKPAEVDEKVEEEPEVERKEEEIQQTSPEEITEGESVRSQADGEDKKEEENEGKTEEKIENESISEANLEQAEKTHGEEDGVTDAEKVEEAEKDENVEKENSEDKPEVEEVTPDKSDEVENAREMNTATAGKGNDDDGEKEERVEDENEVEQGESTRAKENKESEETEVGTDKNGEGEELSETVEEQEKRAEADLDEDKVEHPDEDVVEPVDGGDKDEARGTQMAEETPTSLMEGQDAKKETETESGHSEKGEIAGENGEISTGVEKKSIEDEGEGEDRIDGELDVKTVELNGDEAKTEDRPTEDESPEVKEILAESGKDDEQHEEDVKVPSDTDAVESVAKEGDGSVGNQDESTTNQSEPEASDVKAKEESESGERKDEDEDLKQDENTSDPPIEKRDSDTTVKNDGIQSNVSEVEAPSPSDQAQSKSSSKASEEGASVLLNPQARSSPLPSQQYNPAAETTEEEGIAVGKETPDVLAREDNTALVTNWVAMHQTLFLETSIEPLEDLKDSHSDIHNSGSNEEATTSAQLPRAASPLKIEYSEQEHTLKDVDETRDLAKEEAVEADLESDCPEERGPPEKNPEDTLQETEETEGKDFIPKTESELNDSQSVKEEDRGSEEHKVTTEPLEESKVHGDLMQNNNDKTDISKTEVESIESVLHPVTVGRPESISENQWEEKTTNNDPNPSDTQTATEEVTDLLLSTKTERDLENSTSPVQSSNEHKDTSDTLERSEEVTEISDFRASWSEDGSQEGSRPRDVPPKPSSIVGDRGHVIEDIAHTLSKDRLSTFSVDESLFGRGSHSLLTAVRSESGH